MSEASTDFFEQHRLIRALELNLEKLEHGLAMPRDEDAITETKAMLERVRSRLASQLRGEKSVGRL